MNIDIYFKAERFNQRFKKLKSITLPRMECQFHIYLVLMSIFTIICCWYIDKDHFLFEENKISRIIAHMSHYDMFAT